MPFYDCTGCGAVFHRPTEEPYLWCSCGEALDSAAILPHLPEPRPRRVEILNRPAPVTQLALVGAPAPRVAAPAGRFKLKRKRRPA